MSPAISAIIFDCDGVLVDSEVLALEIELAALAQAGLTYEIAEYKARFMGTSSAAFYAALEEDCLARNGRSLPSDFRETCKAQWRRAAHRLAEVPGAGKAIAPPVGLDGIRGRRQDRIVGEIEHGGERRP